MNKKIIIILILLAGFGLLVINGLSVNDASSDTDNNHVAPDTSGVNESAGESPDNPWVIEVTDFQDMDMNNPHSGFYWNGSDEPYTFLQTNDFEQIDKCLTRPQYLSINGQLYEYDGEFSLTLQRLKYVGFLCTNTS